MMFRRPPTADTFAFLLLSKKRFCVLGICFSLVFILVGAASAQLTGGISGTATVCQNATTQITFTGSTGVLPYTFYYNINGSGFYQAVTSGGSSSVSINASTASSGTFNYNVLCY
jgi:hypothetical protein